MAGALGWFVGHRRSSSEPATAAVVLGDPIARGSLRLSLPEGWSVDDAKVSSGSVLNGLSILAARPDVPKSARMIAWVSTGEVNPQLLPLGRIDPASLERTPEATTVEFPNGQTALRYDELRLRGRESPLRVYVAPTTKGVVTLACPADYLPQPCDAVATTLSAAGADPLPVDPDSTVAEGMRGALSRLGDASAAPAQVLAETTQGTKVVDASGALAAAYRAAADSVKAIDAPLGATTVSFDGIASRLAAVSKAYASIQSAAEQGDRSAYEAARAKLGKARAGLEASLASLRRQGYDVKVSS